MQIFEETATEACWDSASPGLFFLSSLTSGPFVSKTHRLWKIENICALIQVWNYSVHKPAKDNSLPISLEVLPSTIQGCLGLSTCVLLTEQIWGTEHGFAFLYFKQAFSQHNRILKCRLGILLGFTLPLDGGKSSANRDSIALWSTRRAFFLLNKGRYISSQFEQ